MVVCNTWSILRGFTTWVKGKNYPVFAANAIKILISLNFGVMGEDAWRRIRIPGASLASCYAVNFLKNKNSTENEEQILHTDSIYLPSKLFPCGVSDAYILVKEFLLCSSDQCHVNIDIYQPSCNEGDTVAGLNSTGLRHLL